MDTSTKLYIGLAAGLLASAGVYFYVVKPKKATPNLRRTGKGAPSKKAVVRAKRATIKALKAAKKKRVRRAARRRGPGKIITIGTGARARRWGHTIAPKKHRRKGATKQSQYAWPEGFKYPIYDARHVRAAKAYFPRFKKDLPMNVRRVIAENINKADKKFGIGGKKVLPNRRRRRARR